MYALVIGSNNVLSGNYSDSVSNASTIQSPPVVTGFASPPAEPIFEYFSFGTRVKTHINAFGLCSVEFENHPEVLFDFYRHLKNE